MRQAGTITEIIQRIGGQGYQQKDISPALVSKKFYRHSPDASLL